MYYPYRAFQVRVIAFEILGHIVAVAGIVGHHEQDGLLAHLFVFGVCLAPLDHAQMDIVRVFLGEFNALSLNELCAAGGVGQHGMLDDILRDGFNQRVIGNGLNEDSAVVVLGRGCHVHLQGEGCSLLLQTVVDVFDGFEPCHARVMDVVRLVVQDHQFVNIAHYHAQIHLRVSGGAAGPFAQEVIHCIFIIGRSGNFVTGIYAVDIGQKDIACMPGDAHVVLHVQGQLEIVAPVAPVHAVVRNDRVIKKYSQPLKILVYAVKHDDVRRDYQKVTRQPGVRLVKFVIEAPCKRKAHNLGFAGAGRHLYYETPPCLIKHPRRDCAGAIVPHEVELVLHFNHVIQVDDGL